MWMRSWLGKTLGIGSTSVILNFWHCQNSVPGSLWPGPRPSVKLSHRVMLDHGFRAVTKDVPVFSDCLSGMDQNCTVRTGFDGPKNAGLVLDSTFFVGMTVCIVVCHSMSYPLCYFPGVAHLSPGANCDGLQPPLWWKKMDRQSYCRVWFKHSHITTSRTCLISPHTCNMCKVDRFSTKFLHMYRIFRLQLTKQRLWLKLYLRLYHYLCLYPWINLDYTGFSNRLTFDTCPQSQPEPQRSQLTTHTKKKNSHCSHTQAQRHKQTIESSLKADTFSFSSHWNFVTDGVLMDGQRKDATHSTIWLMPRPLLMNYAKLCPRERSHMFIMKAAGVLDIPWVAPNELRVTGQHDTQYHTAKGRKNTHTHTRTTFSGFIRMCSSGNFDWVIKALVFSRLDDFALDSCAVEQTLS